MGAELSRPVASKFIQRDSNDSLRVGCAELNGNRFSMQDMHSIVLSSSADVPSFVGVFDGHGGVDCAKFLSTCMPRAVLDEYRQQQNQSDTDSTVTGVTNVTNVATAFDEKRQEQNKSNTDSAVANLSNVTNAFDDSSLAPPLQSRADAERALKRVALELDAQYRQDVARRFIEEHDSDGSTAVFALIHSPTVTRTPATTATATAMAVFQSEHAHADANADANANADGTLLAAVSKTWHLTIGNVGDSRGLLVRKDGTFVALTQDHKPEVACERERIYAAGGFVSGDGRVDDNLNMSRTFGDFGYKADTSLAPEQQKLTCVPDVTVAQAHEGDCLILFSDGVTYKYVNNEMIAHFIRAQMIQPGPTMTSIAAAAVGTAKAATETSTAPTATPPAAAIATTTTPPAAVAAATATTPPPPPAIAAPLAVTTPTPAVAATTPIPAAVVAPLAATTPTPAVAATTAIPAATVGAATSTATEAAVPEIKQVEKLVEENLSEINRQIRW